ncbi:flavodoxin FldA [Microcoleus sp. FACHB-1515]|uniref:flavodoxin FldA n=1 Tax=Cyanophyceae TaxID=3028117 RepID=UPI00168563AE|nr:flavodoxin FldA [Microcoleus sp. FACHB-1515]MBD2090462.1 flavodoxin FldA [Microcoleus sp. FACHB-1515]
MAKIGLFFGTQTGNTESIAQMIQQAFGGESVVTLHEIFSAEPSDFEAYDRIIIGCPTWNIGELQSDWAAFFDELDNIDFSSKKVAYFGAGDQVGYADNFQDAIGILEEKISEQGGTTIGYWSAEGYEFNESKALRDGKFCGLAIDEDNQPELTSDRIQAWVAQLQQEFAL